MRLITIKQFVIGMLIFLFAGEASIFYSFYKDARDTTLNLLEENIKVNVFNLKHFLDKNFQPKSIGNIASFLDNKIHTNPLIKDLIIVSRNKQILYSTERARKLQIPKTACLPIRAIEEADIYHEKCFTFKIKQFDGLSPYYLTGYIYLDTAYIDHLIDEKGRKFLLYAVEYILFFSLFIWLLIRFILIHPLEKLRQYAYYSVKAPGQFLISELESIRYSLKLTFERLRKEQQELYMLSTTDPLSGLYNRLSMTEKINWLISSNSRSHAKFALLFLDLDNFKTFNDIHGHEFGDKILIEVSRRLLHAIRYNDIVSRLGGDEFVIILPEIKNNEHILEVIQRIQSELNKPIVLDETKYHITCSIGVTIYPKDGEDVSTLLKNADIAMYKAKELGKNNFYFFTEHLNESIRQKIHMQHSIRHALDEGYFNLYYQPKIDIHTNRIMGCEGLIRLDDPNDGMVYPNALIPVAEESGLIIPLGRWIIDEAVRQLQAWQETPLADMKLSINISGIQLNDDNFLPYLQNAVGKIDPSKLDIELTESILMEQFEEKLMILEQIKAMGITLSLDDFGTGYSSLSYLKQIPFDTLKIDKSFIDDLTTQKNQSFVKMIIGIAKELHLAVVAEGVENEQQLQYLKQMKCEQYQGYFCSRPLTAKAFEKLFSSSVCSK